jgi:hypothetical protein
MDGKDEKVDTYPEYLNVLLVELLILFINDKEVQKTLPTGVNKNFGKMFLIIDYERVVKQFVNKSRDNKFFAQIFEQFNKFNEKLNQNNEILFRINSILVKLDGTKLIKIYQVIQIILKLNNASDEVSEECGSGNFLQRKTAANQSKLFLFLII